MIHLYILFLISVNKFIYLYIILLCLLLIYNKYYLRNYSTWNGAYKNTDWAFYAGILSLLEHMPLNVWVHVYWNKYLIRKQNNFIIMVVRMLVFQIVKPWKILIYKCIAKLFSSNHFLCQTNRKSSSGWHLFEN